jgi:DNA-binding MarR family transcriptional regulator
MVETLKKHNLTLTEWLLIGSVIDSGKAGLRVSELADNLGVEMPVITNLANRAVDSGWVTRTTDSMDKRSKRIVATKTGNEKAMIIENELNSETAGWLLDLSPEMIKGYLHVVEELSSKTAYSQNND